MGFSYYPPDMHAWFSWYRPGGCVISWRDQPADYDLRASADRPDFGISSTGTTYSAIFNLFFKGSELQLPGQRAKPGRGHHIDSRNLHVATGKHFGSPNQHHSHWLRN